MFQNTLGNPIQDVKYPAWKIFKLSPGKCDIGKVFQKPALFFKIHPENASNLANFYSWVEHWDIHKGSSRGVTPRFLLHAQSLKFCVADDQWWGIGRDTFSSVHCKAYHSGWIFIYLSRSAIRLGQRLFQKNVNLRRAYLLR